MDTERIVELAHVKGVQVVVLQPRELIKETTSGCSECCSADAAKRSSSGADSPSAQGTTRLTSSSPFSGPVVLAAATGDHGVFTLRVVEDSRGR